MDKIEESKNHQLKRLIHIVLVKAGYANHNSQVYSKTWKEIEKVIDKVIPHSIKRDGGELNG
jgi:hypothetical protein